MLIAVGMDGDASVEVLALGAFDFAASESHRKPVAAIGIVPVTFDGPSKTLVSNVGCTASASEPRERSACKLCQCKFNVISDNEVHVHLQLLRVVSRSGGLDDQLFQRADGGLFPVDAEVSLVIDVLRRAMHRRVVLIPDALVSEGDAPSFLLRPPRALLAIAVVRSPHVRGPKALMLCQRFGDFCSLGFA